MDKNFESKFIKERGKIPNQQFQDIQTNKIFYIAQQFTTAPISPNPYTNWTLNNMDLVKTMNNKQKDWTKKYHKIIWEIERMVDVQLQLQNITKLAEEANMQIAEIEGTILQASYNYWTQTAEDIFSISEDLWNIIQSDMEN